MKKPDKKFEELIGELESIVTELDSSLGLEESLKKYEVGMALAKEAEERLKVIENQFQKIQQQFASAPTEEKIETTESDFEI